MNRQSGFSRFCRCLFLIMAATPGVLCAQEVYLDTTPGAGTFTVPESVREITVEVWGAGGSGSGGNGGGGGGGAYSSEILRIEPGAGIPYSVGSGAPSASSNRGGDSWFSDPSTVLAKGGASATGRAGASGGNAAEGVGSSRAGGGSGASGASFFGIGRGGGGGSSAWPNGDGVDGSDDSGGVVPDGGGNGGDAGVTLDFERDQGEPGSLPGGGGGGGDVLSAGGPGGDGQIRITYQPIPLCSVIYDSADGINENLPESEYLDLSIFDPRNPQPWPANNVIPSGEHVYVGRNFPNNASDITVDGRARVLVDGDLSINNTNFNINANGNAGDLLLIVDGDLTITRPNVTINAIVYVTGNISFDNNSVIAGALAAEGNIDIGGGQSAVTYDGSAVSQVDFGGACVRDEQSVVLDHIRIVHPGLGLTCQASELQVLACADGGCNELYPDPVDITLQPAGWLPAQNVTVTGAASLQFQRSSAETVALSVSSLSPAADNDLVCVAPDGSDSCAMIFRDAGFVFEVPDLEAGVENTFSMAALETDQQTGQCNELFAGETRNIGFGTAYLNPGPVGREASFPTIINGEPVATDGTSQTDVPVTFDSNGVAELSIRYDDAGRNNLAASYLEDSQPDGGTLLIEGNADYVSVPYGLCLIPEKQCASASLDCTGPDSIHTAGQAFNVLPKAYRFSSDVESLSCADKLPAPSFAQSGVPLRHQVMFPVGGLDGALLEAGLSYGVGEEPVTLSEVGVFNITTEAVPGGYLGRDVPESDPMTSPRLVPAALRVTVAEQGEFSPALTCSGFTYSGQVFGLNDGLLPRLTVEALNARSSPQRTGNYTHPDMIEQLGAERFLIAVPDSDGTAVWQDGSATPLPFRTEPEAEYLIQGGVEEESAGVVGYTWSDTERFVYPKSGQSRIEPFEPDLTFILSELSDKDGVQAINLPVDGLVIEPLAAFAIRYGRLAPQNVYGPENIEELEMPLYMEYWNGSRFVINTADSCAPWSSADISNTANHHSLVADSGDFIAGEAGPLILEANGTAGTDVLIWAVEDWQQDDLDGDGTLDAPTATATFGVYRGHDRVIYWREVTN